VADIWLHGLAKILISPVALADPHKPFRVGAQGVELAYVADVRQVESQFGWQVPAIAAEIAIWGIVERFVWRRSISISHDKGRPSQHTQSQNRYRQITEQGGGRFHQST
jgi:hypothetical protein